MNNKRNTLQKQIVYETFESMHNHPSAGMVYEAVNAKFPGISKATVYRLLSEAAEEGKILRLKLGGSVDDRYDITLKKHYHIVCRECGHVADVEVEFDDELLSAKTVGMEGFTVEACNLEFRGLCSDCLKKSKNN